MIVESGYIFDSCHRAWMRYIGEGYAPTLEGAHLFRSITKIPALLLSEHRAFFPKDAAVLFEAARPHRNGEVVGAELTHCKCARTGGCETCEGTSTVWFTSSPTENEGMRTTPTLGGIWTSIPLPEVGNAGDELVFNCSYGSNTKLKREEVWGLHRHDLTGSLHVVTQYVLFRLTDLDEAGFLSLWMRPFGADQEAGKQADRRGDEDPTNGENKEQV